MPKTLKKTKLFYSEVDKLKTSFKILQSLSTVLISKKLHGQFFLSCYKCCDV